MPPPDVPIERKLGYAHMVEMREIEEGLRAKGLNGAELHFASVSAYEVRHKSDPTLRQRQDAARSTEQAGPQAKRLDEILREALEMIRDGHNDPRGLAQEVLANTSPERGNHD